MAHKGEIQNPDRDKEVIRLYSIGLSYGEIAERTGITDSAAAGIVNRARASRKIKRKQALALEANH